MFSFWTGNGNWRGFKATTLLFICGLVDTVVKNYWVFTPTPLDAYNLEAEEAQKFFYFVANLVTTLALYTAAGVTIDYLHSIWARGHVNLLNEGASETRIYGV